MKRQLATAILAAALGLAAAPAALAQQVIGISAAVRNDVRIKKVGTPLPRPAQVKQRVALNDQVQTGVKSQLQVLLLDKSVFTVGANARLTIDKYVYDPSRGTRSVGATVSKGAFRFMSGKPDRSNGSEIRTPVASIGIRGTILEGVVGESAALIAANEPGIGPGVVSDPATATLVILRGPGRNARGNIIPGELLVSAGGRSVTVDRPMLAVYIPRPGAAPIGPFRISPSALRQVQALLYPAVAERLGMRGPADNLGGDPGSVYYPPERAGPTYPPEGPYPPGTYPPGSFPGRAPGGRSSSPGVPGVPGAGPGGFGIPNVPIPQGGPRRQRPNNAPNDPAPNNNAPPPNNAAGGNSNPSPAGGNNNPPPGGNNSPNGGNSLKSAAPPAGGNPPPVAQDNPNNSNPPPNNSPAGKPAGKDPPPPPPK